MLYTHSLADADAVEFGGAPPSLRVSPSFTCAHSDARAGAAGVRLAGDLDLATAWWLERALRDAQAEAGQVVLDLSDLTFLDCSGIRVILDAAERARREGHRLTVVPGPAQVNMVFTLTGAADVIEMSAGAG